MNLADAILCSGGEFDVEWRGHVSMNTTIVVANRTVLRNSDVVGSGSTSFVGNSASRNGGALYIASSSHVGWNMHPTFGQIVRNYTTFTYSTTDWTVVEQSGETVFWNNIAGE